MTGIFFGLIIGRLLETVIVPSESRQRVTSHLVLQQGTKYTLVAAGDVKVGSVATLRGDAQYQDFTQPCAVSADGTTKVGLRVKDAEVEAAWSVWGTYRPTHIYRLDVVGDAKPIRIYYSDQASTYPLY